MTPPRLRLLEVPAGPAALSALDAVAAALDGAGPALLPYAAGSPPPQLPSADSGMEATFETEGLALVVGTSGSTGSPKLAMLSGSALRASAAATHRRLGGPGRWVLALPAHHIAGMQVLVRSVLAGTSPVAVDARAGFTTAAFAQATKTLSGWGRHYTALVPTQLVRLLAEPAGVVALRRYDAVLVGAAACPESVLADAARQRVRVVTTYGMSETAGGCVYDGRPLHGSAYRLGPDGRIELGGDTLADGYLGRPDLTAVAFSRDSGDFTEDFPQSLPDSSPAPVHPVHPVHHAGAVPEGALGMRWFRTDDLGSVNERRGLVVEGRIDDLISTGGLKVAPRLVEQAVVDHVAGVHEALVVGVEDAEWGQRVGVALVLAGGAVAPTLADVRAQLAGILPAHALPTVLTALAALPQRGPGKPDRAAVAVALSALSAADGSMTPPR